MNILYLYVLELIFYENLHQKYGLYTLPNGGKE